MNFDSEYIIKMSVTFIKIIILFLHTNLPVIVELAGKQQMIGLFNFEIIAWPNWMNESLKTIFVLDNSAIFHSQSYHVDTIFWKNQEIIGTK